MFRITTAFAALMLLCAGAEAASYGAIAFSPDTGAAGYSTRRQSRGNAQEWALYYCGQHANDCRIAINFRNACGAVARGRNGGWGSDWGVTRAEAQNDAVAACSQYDSGCRVIQWACSK
jgi:serine/threonine-protein kinase